MSYIQLFANIHLSDFKSFSNKYHLNDKPDKCPICHHKIIPELNLISVNNEYLEAIYLCPNDLCNHLFIAEYNGYYSGFHLKNVYNFVKSKPLTYQPIVFKENIVQLSPAFIEIYNQALHAEVQNLSEISGMGYRKALEFLIKDYLIYKNPDMEEKIKSSLLGKCIKDNISNDNIKKCAERATWLGNDETHYVRKWEDKDISDLKKLIDLTVFWIESELLTEQYLNDMK